MGHIPSASTVYSVAYLTEKGRALLFDENNTRFFTDPNTGQVVDLFKIEYFTLSDPDINYNLSSGYLLGTGQIPDVSGKNQNCIKGALDSEERCLISYDGVISGGSINNNAFVYEYDTNISDDILIININVGSLGDELPVQQ